MIVIYLQVLLLIASGIACLIGCFVYAFGLHETKKERITYSNTNSNKR